MERHCAFPGLSQGAFRLGSRTLHGLTLFTDRMAGGRSPHRFRTECERFGACTGAHVARLPHRGEQQARKRPASVRDLVHPHLPAPKFLTLHAHPCSHTQQKSVSDFAMTQIAALLKHFRGEIHGEALRAPWPVAGCVHLRISLTPWPHTIRRRDDRGLPVPTSLLHQ
jgi:hypothetical protein